MELLPPRCVFQCLLVLLLSIKEKSFWLIYVVMVMKLLLQEVDVEALLEMLENKRRKVMALTTNVMKDESDKVLILGRPGEDVSLKWILRVVADVGLVVSIIYIDEGRYVNCV